MDFIAEQKKRTMIERTAEGKEKFGINVRWNVEGFGYIFITADNAGEFYSLPPAGKSTLLNLNYELARSRVARNKNRPAKIICEAMFISQNLLSPTQQASFSTQRNGRAAIGLQVQQWPLLWIDT
jgi:hypothetical protein